MTEIAPSERSFDVLDYKLPGVVFMPENPNMGFVLWLYGSNSNRQKHYPVLGKIASEVNLPTFCFDYSGHGDAPFEFDKTTPAQHFLEVITVYDELCAEFGCGGGAVVSTSYGSYLQLQLLKYRQVIAGILRAPAMFRPSSFYTRWENLLNEDEDQYRHDPDELAKHPLLARAGANKAPMLVVEHAADDVIPSMIPTTIAHMLGNAELKSVPDLPHSLSQATEEQCIAYEDMLISWLKKHLKPSQDQV